METSEQHTRRFLRARSRMRELRDFYITVVGYCLLMPFLMYLNLHFTPEYHWFWVPVVGGIISIMIYGFLYLFLGPKWEDRKIREILNKKQ